MDLSPMEEVLAEAAVLFDLDAARAEAWASGLLAELPDVDELLAGLRAAGDRRALAVAVALSPMAAGAREVADELARAGHVAPAFAGAVGTATAVGAWAIADRYGTGTSIVIEYEHVDGVVHDVLVETDGDTAVDILVSPPGVVEVASGESNRLRVDRISGDDAAARIRAALANTASRPDVPVTDAFLLNHALIAARLDVEPLRRTAVDAEPSGRPPRPSDREGDSFALATLSSVFELADPVPAALAEEVSAAAATLRSALRRGDPTAVALAAEVAIDEPERVDDVELLRRIAGGYVAPGPRVGLSPAAADAIDGLEWADWLGAVVQLVRSGPAADASPEQLVRNINRCPEVTTQVPKRDAPAVASAFDRALPAWRLSGAVDDGDRLTAFGAWLLPQALAAVWSDDQ